MMLVVERGQHDKRSECCEEVEQRLGYEDTEVGWLWGPYK